MTQGQFNLYVIPFVVVLFLVVYMLVQFTGERLKISPVLIIGGWSWMTLGEAVLLFVVFLGISMVITLNLAFYILKKFGGI